ncbi:AglZ/HisF2 family acetamidino modification protein [Ekhidna sp.]|uniref:AglZ/HisF2 family acetamidino modification protein n=1 Tax=Ekhidna sp. TaxID=2608089 RepID=UPI003B514D88
MRRVRVIPTLLIQNGRLVKSFKFKKHDYLGDPINAVRIFNDKQVDELALLNISTDRHKKEINYDFIEQIVSEAFMPIAFGGGIKNIDQIRKILNLGVEKVVINKSLSNKDLIRNAASEFGSQSILASIDINKNFLGKEGVYLDNGRKKWSSNTLGFAIECEKLGIGEIILHSIYKDGTYNGYDLELLKKVSDEVSIPVVALGGASSIEDFYKAVESGASAVAAGSLFAYSGKREGVLINYPKQIELKEKLFNRLTR